MKYHDLIGPEVNKYERRSRRELKRFFRYDNLQFFKYLEKKYVTPKHLMQRTLNWLITSDEQPELNNHHDELGNAIWDYYEQMIYRNYDLTYAPDTEGLSKEDAKYAMENYYGRILAEIQNDMWYEIHSSLANRELSG